LKADPALLEKRLGLSFSNRALLEQALTHRSAGKSNNERLEFVGDAVLGMVIADRLYHQFPDANEGQMSRLRSALVKREALALIARTLKLGDFLTLGEGEQRSGGHTRDSILADATEAVLGACFYDQGYEVVRDLILRLHKKNLAGLTLEQDQKDPKTRLQEWLQARHHPLPVYAVARVDGEQHKQSFHIICSIRELGLSVESVGSSRRKAEQQAASMLLEKLHDG